MNAATKTATRHTRPATAGHVHDSHTAALRKIKQYYSKAAQDYLDWDTGLNMHFGLCGLQDDVLNRNAMLERMNHYVLRRVLHDQSGPLQVADLGCGTGATSRALVRMRPDVTSNAITICAEQITLGTALNQHLTPAQAGSIRFAQRDFLDTGLATNSMDGAWCIESACHAPGAGKDRLIREAARILKPGARLVIGDAMRRDDRPLAGLLGMAYKHWCNNWAVPQMAQLPALIQALERNGFSKVQIEEVSARVTMSAAHIPWVSTSFTLKQLWTTRGRLPAWRWQHIGASYLSLLLGVSLHRFGYFVITAEKR